MKRMMVLVPLFALALAGCSDMPKTWRQSEIEEIAANTAEDFADAGSANVSNELSTRINDLEQRIDQLERENRAQDDMIEALRRHQGQVADYLSATR
jgi:TolA-binding protein